MNSSLVDKVIYSPHSGGKRTMSIDRITPHCVVGQCSIETLGKVFSSTRIASSNYGIGADGRIGLYVDEDCRSKCSSSAANDQRAVTIECASDNKEPFAFNSTVYNKLIELCVDICYRNGKTKLLWIDNKDRALSYKPAANEMLITVHRWFANKSCPGNWLYTRLNDVAAKVTEELSKKENNNKYTGSCLSVQDTKDLMWKMLNNAIGNSFGVAGLMGNIECESAFKSSNLQNTGNKALNLTDEEYCQRVDSGAISPYTYCKDGYGIGLAQWTWHTRKMHLLNYMHVNGLILADTRGQIEYLISEIKTYNKVWTVLQNAKTVKEASDAVLLYYEAPASKDNPSTQKYRASKGEAIYAEYVKEPTTQCIKTGDTVEFIDVNVLVELVKNNIVKFTVNNVENEMLTLSLAAPFTVHSTDVKIVDDTDHAPVPTPVPVPHDVPDYLVEVKAGTAYYKSYSKNSGINGIISKTGIYTIVAECGDFGELKSGAGYLYIPDVRRL